MSTTIDTGLEAADTPFTVAAVFDTEDRSIAAVSALNRDVLPSNRVTIVAPAAPKSAGSLVATLVDQGVVEQDARAYARRVDAGGILVTVNADRADQAAEAQRLLLAHGGADVRRYQRH